MVVTSLENERIKKICKLHKKKFRDLNKQYLIEGEHLVIEANKANVIETLILLDGEDFDIDCEKIYVNNDVLKKISKMDSPPKIMAVCRKKSSNEILGNKILLLDEVQDPGNLGTIVRSSVAFNVDTIILSEKCVDLYNPKVLRATQGLFNQINIINMDIDSALDYMKNNNIPIYGTSVVNGVEASTLSNNEKSKYCLIMGNEGCGVDHKILAMCDKNLYIKMSEKAESLNVGVACSILLYEMER